MDYFTDFKVGLWMCSCCGKVYDGSQEQPVNVLTLELFECALCDVVNAERQLSES